jgi:hypothetical protein
VDRTLLGDERLTAKTRHVQQHAPRDDARGPVGDRAKACPVEGDLVACLTAVPHAVLVPDVAQRIEVRRRLAVVRDAVVIERASAGASVDQAHEVLRGVGVVRRWILGKLAAE